jgi:hypothetical protein
VEFVPIYEDDEEEEIGQDPEEEKKKKSFAEFDKTAGTEIGGGNK